MNEDGGGVPMVCATSVMKPGRARIGKIGGNIALPRTIPIINLFATGIGAFIGLWISMFVGGMNAVAVGLGIGGLAGWMAVTYSPLQNESLLKWFELKFKSQTRTRYVNGHRVTVTVGTAVIMAPSSGPVMLLRSAVRVAPGQYDDRGAVRSAANQNVEGTSDLALLGRGRAPAPGATPLPMDVAVPETRRTRRERPNAPQVVPAAAPHEYEPMAGPARRLKD